MVCKNFTELRYKEKVKQCNPLNLKLYTYLKLRLTRMGFCFFKLPYLKVHCFLSSQSRNLSPLSLASWTWWSPYGKVWSFVACALPSKNKEKRIYNFYLESLLESVSFLPQKEENMCDSFLHRCRLFPCVFKFPLTMLPPGSHRVHVPLNFHLGNKAIIPETINLGFQ